MPGDAWCSPEHERRGVVTNADPKMLGQPRTGPVLHVAVCDESACVARAVKYVNTTTRQAVAFYPAQTNERSAG